MTHPEMLEALRSSDDVLVRLIPFMECIRDDATYKPGEVQKLILEMKRVLKFNETILNGNA